MLAPAPHHVAVYVCAYVHADGDRRTAAPCGPVPFSVGKMPDSVLQLDSASAMFVWLIDMGRLTFKIRKVVIY